MQEAGTLGVGGRRLRRQERTVACIGAGALIAVTPVPRCGGHGGGGSGRNTGHHRCRADGIEKQERRMQQMNEENTDDTARHSSPMREYYEGVL